MSLLSIENKQRKIRMFFMRSLIQTDCNGSLGAGTEGVKPAVL